MTLYRYSFLVYLSLLFFINGLKGFDDDLFAEDDLINGFDFPAETELAEDSSNLMGMDGMPDMEDEMGDMDMEELQRLTAGFGGQGFEVNTKQMKFLTCSVCKLLVESSFNLIKETRETQPKRIYNEYEIDEILESICDPFMAIGTWLGNYEIIEVSHPTKESKKSFELKKIEEPVACMEDCYTLKEKCLSIYGAVGTDLVVQLWKKTPLEEVEKKICFEEMKSTKGSCGRKPLYFNSDQIKKEL